MAPETQWLDQDESRLWRTWLRFNSELASALNAQLVRDSGLSGADYAVLVPLSEAPDGILRSRDLREQIAWDRARLSHQVRRMEQRGLVAREDCEEDARAAMIRLTDEGYAAIARAAAPHVATTRQYFFDQLADDEVVMLADICERLLANIDPDAAPTQPPDS